METMLLLALVIGAMVVTAIVAVRAVQRPQRHQRRRQRAAQHAVNVRLWYKLFARHDRRWLTDQRELARERSK